MKRMIRKTCGQWDEWSTFRINDLKTLNSKHGLDLTKTGFIRSEVLKANECIYISEDDKVIAFAFLITSKRPRALYITLMASFKKGSGSKIIQFLSQTHIYQHEFIALRATTKSLGFYLKQNFFVFDFGTLSNYINGNVDNAFTQQLIHNMYDLQALSNLQHILVERKWINTDEFPLLKRRSKH